MPPTLTATILAGAVAGAVLAASAVLPLRWSTRGSVHSRQRQSVLLNPMQTGALERIVTATAYCPCVRCTGDGDGITASGVRAVAGVTVAANGFPFETRIRVEPSGSRDNNPSHGIGVFTVQDRMARSYGPDRIDIFFDTHAEALRFGKRRVKVTIIEP